MKNYYNFVKTHLGVSECFVSQKYCNIGHSFCVNNDEIEGLYWFYETDNFIIDIHDFFIKKEIINTYLPDIKKFITFSSSYIISGSGESFNPYQTFSANSLYNLDIENLEKNYRFLLHENSLYLGIAINFKPQMIEDCLSCMKTTKNVSYSHMFQDTKAIITNSLDPIAKDILNCKMESPAAEMFFEAKVKEWISIVIDAFLNRKNSYISSDDNIALENVANYLDDHYALDISQKTLEKISIMSGTKLKKLFKEKYQCSITEYTQRKRMNVAENLLLNSTLKIQDIAEAVGYSSHSKFTACYKKYKGVYPKDTRKFLSRKNSMSPCVCDKNI